MPSANTKEEPGWDPWWGRDKPLPHQGMCSMGQGGASSLDPVCVSVPSPEVSWTAHRIPLIPFSRKGRARGGLTTPQAKPLPSICINILLEPMGATCHSFRCSHQLHTSGKGTIRSPAPAFPRPHPGVCPLPLPLQEGARRVEGWTLSCSCGLSGGK